MGYLPSIATTSLILLSILYCSVSRYSPLGTLNRKISVCFEQSFPKILNVFREFSLSSSVHTLEYPNSSLILAWKTDFPSFPSFPTTHMTFLSHGLSKYCLKSICHPLHSMSFISIFFHVTHKFSMPPSYHYPTHFHCIHSQSLLYSNLFQAPSFYKILPFEQTLSFSMQ